MAYTVVVEHEGGQVEVEVDASVDPGIPARLNPPSKAHPAEGPYLDGIYDMDVVSDELDRDNLDVDEIFEEHEEEFIGQIIEEDRNRAMEDTGPEYDPVED